MNGSSYLNQSPSKLDHEEDILNKLPFYSQAGKDSVKLYKGLREAKKLEKKKKMLLSKVNNAAGAREMPRYMEATGIKDIRTLVRSTLEKNSKKEKQVPALLKMITDPDQKMALIGCMKQRAVKILLERHPNIEIPTLNLAKTSSKEPNPTKKATEGSPGSRSPRFEQLAGSLQSSRHSQRGEVPPVGHYKPDFRPVDRNPRKPAFTKGKRSSIGLPPDAAIFLTYESINKSRVDTNRSGKSSPRGSIRNLCSKSVEHERNEFAYKRNNSQNVEKKRDLISKIIPYDKSLKKTLPRIASYTAKSPRLQTPNHTRQPTRHYGSRPDLIETQDEKAKIQKKAYRFQLRSLDFEKMHKPSSIFELTSATGHLDYTNALQAAHHRPKIASPSFGQPAHPRSKPHYAPPSRFTRDFFNDDQDRPRHQKTYSFGRSPTKHLNYWWAYLGPTLSQHNNDNNNKTAADAIREERETTRQKHKQARARRDDAAIQHEDWRLVFEGS